ncbi:hypothetical protein O3682_00885 [Neisseria sp. 27098_8_112]|uniref:hypothetical protein n=1 Tax=Neisseria sp. 27098_8_112 TaxID=3003682 RepID=UPI00352DD19A
MDNSNENTQNPKENQNKMTDEGIQEHSVENKQPAQQRTQTIDYFEIFSKISRISTVLGILFGGSVIYIYLLKIDQLSILPEVISNPSNLIAAITIFIPIFIIIILLYYLSLHLLLILFPFIRKLLLTIQNYRNSKSPKENNSNDNSNEIILGLFYILIILSINFWLLPKFLKSFLEYLFPKIDGNIYILFIPLFFLIIGNFLRNKLFENSNLKEFIINILTILAIVMNILILALPDKTRILNFTHAIEIPRNSSWYLLHNNFQQNNGSQETNGIDKNDLIKLKQNFKCSILSEEEKTEKNIECSSIPEQRNNALYGYMAWNLGDTKVFCPPTTDNTKIDDIEEWKIPAEKLGKECIVISGKALQIMPKGYISTNIDGIDDGNPENTGHDDPAIDINTDVRFKNDLNAQSNAGLNNFNVQPVLPIQSNAKNMSIQINYGSCNHDSPRNKDGHPDIGYTDKKICQ